MAVQVTRFVAHRVRVLACLFAPLLTLLPRTWSDGGRPYVRTYLLTYNNFLALTHSLIHGCCRSFNCVSYGTFSGGDVSSKETYLSMEAGAVITVYKCIARKKVEWTFLSRKSF